MTDKNIEIKIGTTTDNYIELLVKLHKEIVRNIQENTKCPKDRLDKYISDDIFSYKISNLGTEEINKIIESAENISNNMCVKDFIMTILTDNGKDMMPTKMHKLMKDKYALKDNIEWFVSLMFINIGGLITEPEFCYRTIDEDMKANDCSVVVIKK